ncbi:uncharacterized protein V6R79_001996 [Siganus canaliculatus]
MATLDAADSPGELAHMLNKAYKKIANLLEDVDRMSSELQRKDSVLITLRSRFPTLTNWLETSRTGEAALQNNTSALGQTVLWDPSSSCQRPACSTPNRGTPLDRSGHPRAEESSERGPRRGSFSPVTAHKQKSATRDLHQQTSPVPAATDTLPPLTDTTAFPPLAATCPPAGGCPARSRPPEPTRPSSQRKRLVRDAVRWHSSCSPRPARDHTRSPGVGDGMARVAELARSPEDRADAPKTLVIGDSIVRNVRMRGAVTMSFPGATVAEVMRKISDILSSHPQLKRIIIHAGTNDIARQQSEVLKQDFRDLFNSISQSQVTVFISGPTPTCGRGIGSFSRLLSLNTWLSSSCSSHHVGFINNFDLFWERRHLFGPDGIHLNRAGARMLSGNLAYGIQHAIITKPAPAALSHTD